MSALRDTIVAWTDQYLQEILAAPRMWGSLEAVEMQVLQLLEVRALALRPNQEIASPRRVLDSYAAFLRGRYPNQPALPLFQLLEAQEEQDFVRTLAEFQGMMARAVLPENPFAHSQLAVRLTFDAGHQPTASAFTGYYEEFRRALRATARNDGSVGRPKKEIESVTDFALEDAVVTRPNGAAGQVLLRLGMSGVQDAEAEERVREGFSKMLTLAEWAASDATLDELTVDDPEQRTRVAVQARRLLPRRGIEKVAVGGLFVARSKPVEFHASYEKRFLEVVSSESTQTPFDRTDEIRAIDLDRGLVVLGKERMQCFIGREELAEVNAVGIRARVRGHQYQSLLGKTFVLAESVEPQLGSNEN